MRIPLLTITFLLLYFYTWDLNAIIGGETLIVYNTYRTSPHITSNHFPTQIYNLKLACPKASNNHAATHFLSLKRIAANIEQASYLLVNNLKLPSTFDDIDLDIS